MEGNVVIKFRLDSTQVAENIKFVKRLGAVIDESILKGLENFEFNFENETEIKDLNGIFTFSFKLYPQKEKVKVN